MVEVDGKVGGKLSRISDEFGKGGEEALIPDVSSLIDIQS